MKTRHPYGLTHLSEFLGVAALLTLVPTGLLAAEVAEEVVFSAPEAQLGIADTATDAQGTHLMMALKMGETTAVYLDGAKLEEVPSVEHMEVLPDGTWALAWADGDSKYLSTSAGTAGPFEGLAMPSAERLTALRTVESDEWSYRGGSRVVMGSRSGDGAWVALLRFMASPGNQDVRPLGTQRQRVVGTDPWTFVGAANRFTWAGTTPISVYRDGERECFLVGIEKRGCGQKVAMFVPAPAGDKFVYALQREASLLAVTPWGEVEVKGRLDWVSFDATGQHLLMTYQDGDGWVLWVDGKAESRWSVVLAAFWKADGTWVAAVEDDQKSWLVEGSGTKQAYPGLQGVGFGPTGEVLVLGMGALGPYVGAMAMAGKAKEAWGLGFTPKGTPYCLVNRGDVAGQSLWFGGKFSAPFPRVRVVGSTPAGTGVLALGEQDRQATLMNGVEVLGVVSGEVDRVVWCGQKPYPILATASGGCVGVGAAPLCCNKLLGVGCQGERPRLLCKEEEGTVWLDPTGARSPSLGEVLPHLLVRTQQGVIDQFAARLGPEWSLRDAEGSKAVGGPVRQALVGPGGPWFLVNEGRSNSWWTSPLSNFGRGQGEGRVQLPVPSMRVKPPFTVSGQGVYWALLEEGEAWVVNSKPLPIVERILTAPVPFEHGFFYWARVAGKTELRKVSGLGKTL